MTLRLSRSRLWILGLLVTQVVLAPATGSAAARTPARITAPPSARGQGHIRPLVGDVVQNTNDSGAGSLRDTIANASAGDTITFVPGLGTITLSSGELLLSKALTISGPATGTQTISGGGVSRVFEIAAGTQVALANLTITGGQSAAGADGGGILNGGNLTLSTSTVSGNSSGAGANGTGQGGGGGGGIANTGTLTITASTIVTNSTGRGGDGPSGGDAGSGGSGGGILNNGMLTVSTSTVSGNSTGNGGTGGSNNGVFGTGGNGGDGGNGGGIASTGALTLTASTIVQNRTGSGGAGGSPGFFGGSAGQTGFDGPGGGLAESLGTIALGATIVATNSVPPGSAYVDVGCNVGEVLASQDYNLIENTTGCTITGATSHDVTGQDPLLGLLQDNGGPTLTLLPSAGSPAVDQIPSAHCAGTDQRGYVRPDAGESTCDIGAVESGATAALLSASGAVPWHAHHTMRLDDHLSASIDLADGHLDLSSSDLSIPGRGPALTLAHTWDSTLAQAGITTTAGQGWQSTLTQSMGGVLTGTVTFTDASGATWPFVYSGAPTAPAPYTSYTVPAGQPWQLTTSTTGYTLSNVLTGETQTFDAQGRYLADADSYANSNTLSYTSTAALPMTETNSGGRALSFYYGANGLLSAA